MPPHSPFAIFCLFLAHHLPNIQCAFVYFPGLPANIKKITVRNGSDSLSLKVFKSSAGEEYLSVDKSLFVDLKRQETEALLAKIVQKYEDFGETRLSKALFDKCKRNADPNIFAGQNGDAISLKDLILKSSGNERKMHQLLGKMLLWKFGEEATSQGWTDSVTLYMDEGVEAPYEETIRAIFVKYQNDGNMHLMIGKWFFALYYAYNGANTSTSSGNGANVNSLSQAFENAFDKLLDDAVITFHDHEKALTSITVNDLEHADEIRLKKSGNIWLMPRGEDGRR